MLVDAKMIYQSYPATKNKWYADIPLKLLSDDFDDVTLHLQDFTIPRIFLGATNINYKSVTIRVPGKAFNSDNKFMTFSYIIDAKWESYLSLFKWASCYPSIDNPVPLDEIKLKPTADAWRTVPIHIYLLDEFKKTSLNIIYYGCMLEEFGEVHVSYKENPDVMIHSFKVSYQRMEIGRSNPLDRNKKI